MPKSSHESFSSRSIGKDVTLLPGVEVGGRSENNFGDEQVIKKSQDEKFSMAGWKRKIGTVKLGPPATFSLFLFLYFFHKKVGENAG